MQCYFRDNVKAYSYGKSTANQRIAGWWSHFRRNQSTSWINFQTKNFLNSFFDNTRSDISYVRYIISLIGYFITIVLRYLIMLLSFPVPIKLKKISFNFHMTIKLYGINEI